MDGAVGGIGTAGNLVALLSELVGETVTIFTSSGGQSGAGFTGVVLAVNPVFVRLITRIGPPPACALGNACTGFAVGYSGAGTGGCGIAGGFAGYGGFAGVVPGHIAPASEIGAATAGGWNGFPVYTVGSITDIPIAAIVSVVHNAV